MGSHDETDVMDAISLPSISFPFCPLGLFFNFQNLKCSDFLLWLEKLNSEKVKK